MGFGCYCAGTPSFFIFQDRKENVYGPFPAKQLVEAHNAGYINDRKVVVREARMRGEFRPIGSQALMHGPSRDEAFKSLTTWPQVCTYIYQYVCHVCRACLSE